MRSRYSTDHVAHRFSARRTHSLTPLSVLLVLLLGTSLAMVGCDKKSEDSEESEGAEGGEGGGEEDSAPEKFDEATLQEIGKVQVDGFELQGEANVSKSGVMATFKANEPGPNSERPASAMTNIMHCIGCQPLTKETWEKNKENLLSMLPRKHIDNPDLVFDIYEIDLGDGKTGIAIYKLSHLVEENASGGMSKMGAHGLNVFYHNDVNMFSTQIFALGGGTPDTLEELKAELSKEDMEDAARQVFAAYAEYF